MKTRLSLALSVGFLSLSAGAGPILMAENAQANTEPVINGGQETIDSVARPQICIPIPGYGLYCW